MCSLLLYIHTYIHTYTHAYIYIYREREREREGEKKKEREREREVTGFGLFFSNKYGNRIRIIILFSRLSSRFRLWL